MGTSNTEDLVRIAFRKLKASVYFDKTALLLRDKVVAFEMATDFEKQLKELANALESDNLDKALLLNDILRKMSTQPFPKKISTADTDNAVINVGNPKAVAIVEHEQWFVDMDVRGHIIGILWIMAIGKHLDDDCYTHARGNRFRSKLIWNEDNGTIKDSPALFEPYFAQYSLWRDDGLTCAQKLLAAGEDALILTLDLKSFYYKTGITREKFDEIIIEHEPSYGAPFDKKKILLLHNAVYSIIEKYNDVLRGNDVDIAANALPIGFLPSAVLSNWCLANFDKGILDYWNPSYYGRYVDDIIIVEKVEKRSEMYNRARKGALTKEEVINYYLRGERSSESPKFVYIDGDKNFSTENTNRTSKDSTAAEKDKVVYRVSSHYCLSDKSRFEFQMDKTRMIMLHADNNSTALINKFKQELYENVSAFRLMPEIGDAFSQDDFSQFYQIENDETINKLRGVKKVSIDKYELSKFLGKYRVVSSLVNDGEKKKFTNIIGKMFNESELIDNYILWERIFEIFITDKDYKGLARFVKKTNRAISTITGSAKCNEGENEVHIQMMKDSLRGHLTASLNRVLSLLWGKIMDQVQTAMNDVLKVDLRNGYLKTRMSNKYITNVPIELLTIPENDKCETLNLTVFEDTCKCLRKDEYDDSYSYLPYFRQAQDIAYTDIIQKIYIDNDDYSESDVNHSYIKRLKNIDADAIDVATEQNQIITVGKHGKGGKLKIAVANVNVQRMYGMRNMLKGEKPNRTYKRYEALADLVNSAIKENAEMLVLPEFYVPLEWLPALATKAAREQLAIITGVEHVLVGKNAYNFTAIILPYKLYGAIPTAAVFFQLKKYYSPLENQLLYDYGFVKPQSASQSRPLYRWRDCYFPVYCCYELASIKDRSEHMSWADMVVAVEYNKDTNYFSSIVESLSRDLHCYCVQVNTSEYGDSRITQPTSSVERDLVSVKGGLNQTILVGEIDFKTLREFQIKRYTANSSDKFKPTPPGFDATIVRRKIKIANEDA